jgi:hypothetical protein
MKARAFKEPIHCARKEEGVTAHGEIKACNACGDIVPLCTSDERWICPRTMRVKPQLEQRYPEDEEYYDPEDLEAGE